MLSFACPALGETIYEWYTATKGNPPEPSWVAKYLGVDDLWAAGYEGSGVTVAVLDTGFDYCIPDLANRVWTNPGEAPPLDNNGLDDDGNGYIDDHWGWDFLNQDNDPIDANDWHYQGYCGTCGHGTGMASIIVGDGTGFGLGSPQLRTGMAPAARFMPLKVAWSNCSGGVNITEAVQYAIDNGADLLSIELNLSYDNDTKKTLRLAMKNAWSSLLAALCSAGIRNTAPPNDIDGPSYCPPPWLNPQMPDHEGDRTAAISVAATGTNELPCTNDLRPTSPLGPTKWDIAPDMNDFPYPPGLTKPDIAAPGSMIPIAESIEDCNRINCLKKYTWRGGTSPSAPVAAGVVAILVCKNNELPPWYIDEVIETTALDLGDPGKDNSFGAGLIQPGAAMAAIDFFNNFDGLVGIVPTHWTIDGDPGGSWEAVPLAPEDGEYFGQAPAAGRTVSTFVEPRSSYFYDFEFMIYPAGVDPSFGALLRYDAGNRCIFIRYWKDLQTNQFRIRFGGEFDQTTYTWADVLSPVEFVAGYTYAWHIIDSGASATLRIDTPTQSNILVFYGVPYSIPGLSTRSKGLLVQEGTKVLFDNVHLGASAGCPFVYLGGDGGRWTRVNNVLSGFRVGRQRAAAGNLNDRDLLAIRLSGEASGVSADRIMYQLRIREDGREHSFFDQLAVTAVDHPQGTEVAVAPDGEFVVYRKSDSRRKATVTSGVPAGVRGNAGETSTYRWTVTDKGGGSAETPALAQSVIVIESNFKFAPDTPGGGSYAKASDYPGLDEGLMVTVRAPSGLEKVFHVIPREEHDATAIPLDLAVASGDLSAEVTWLGQHIVDGVWLAERVSNDAIRTVPLELAVEHSTGRGVATELMGNDGRGIVLAPDESLVLTAMAPAAGTDRRTLLLESRGVYSSDREFMETYAQGLARIVSVAPNPSNPSTTIRYELSSPARVKVNVLDVTGRLVAVLVDAQQDGGAYAVEWEGTTATGRQAASGVYFVRLNVSGSSTTTRLVLLK